MENALLNDIYLIGLIISGIAFLIVVIVIIVRGDTEKILFTINPFTYSGSSSILVAIALFLPILSFLYLSVTKSPKNIEPIPHKKCIDLEGYYDYRSEPIRVLDRQKQSYLLDEDGKIFHQFIGDVKIELSNNDYSVSGTRRYTVFFDKEKKQVFRTRIKEIHWSVDKKEFYAPNPESADATMIFILKTAHNNENLGIYFGRISKCMGNKPEEIIGKLYYLNHPYNPHNSGDLDKNHTWAEATMILRRKAPNEKNPFSQPEEIARWFNQVWFYGTPDGLVKAKDIVGTD